MKFLRRLNYILYKSQKVTVVGIFAVMMLLALLQVILRLFFQGGIQSADIFIRYLVMWIGFLGASLATYKHRHINIDIFGQFMREPNKRIVKIIVNFVALVVAVFFVKASVTYVIDEMSDSTRIFFIPLWVMEVVLPLSFTFMSLKFLQDFLEGIFGKKNSGRYDKAKHDKAKKEEVR